MTLRSTVRDTGDAGPPSAPSVATDAEAYGLSPMQAGMLFQALLDDGDPARSGFDLEQIHVALDEDVDVDAFSAAWTHVARRHPILSTSFRWEGLPRPEQRPEPDVRVPVEVHDWTGIDEDERSRRRAAFLASDRLRAFDLRRAPLLRVAVFRVAPERAEVVWTFHHILLDGRSFAAVLGEAFEAYQARRRGDPFPLRPARRPYRDYVEWLGGLDARASAPFFRELLRAKSAPTPLPCAEPAARPLPRDGHGEIVRRVDPGTTRRVHEAARRTATTVGTLVHAAWALVLSRLTGDEDVLFGTTRACRRSVLGGDADAMVGLFINSLPTRVRVGDDRTVAELLADLRAQSVAMRPHEHTPLVDVQGASEIPRGLPLFETLLMFDTRELNATLRQVDPRWKARACTVHERPPFPLVLTVFDGDPITIRILFDGRRFRDEAVRRIGAYVETALEGLARDERAKLGDVDVLPPDERRRIVVEWNDTHRDFPGDTCIHEPFERQALARPGAVAVETEGERWTFARLEERANRIAHALAGRGVRRGDCVAVCVERGPDLVASLLGVAKAGAAYVPLDPAYPPERLSLLLDDVRARLAVTQERLRARLACDALLLDGSGAEELASAPATRPPRSAAATDACYVIHTSGSTGKPKGVVLTHRAVLNTFDWVSRTFAVGPGDRLLFVTSPCFDLSVYDTFGALGAGATVVVAGSHRLRDPQALASTLVDARITIWDSAPAALQRLVPFLPGRASDAPLRLVMLSGDWIPLAMPDAVRASFPGARVVSLGGATEAAIWSNWFDVGRVDPRWASIPYGRPIQNARYHVLDRRRRPVPIGVAGDLYIGGECLAQGYLRRPELTAERFVDDPFRPGERLYMTGDRARYFDDGELEFLGRTDSQVKIRGFRVELGEVESVLASLPGVSAAVCTAYADASGQRSLAAYVVGRAGEAIDEMSLKAAVAAKLPDFMVPSHVVVLPALPLSPNGKVDRKALPGPTARAPSAVAVEPRDDLERGIARLWGALLGRTEVGATDNFFDLGGHSLLAVVFVARAEQDLGLRVPLSRLLERPTVEALAASLRPTVTPAPRGRHLVTLNAAGTRPPLALVSGTGGFGFIFRGLASRLGDRQTVHVFNAVGADDDGERCEDDIERIAAVYEPQLLAACPSGPVVLGGYSFGVLVAFELACRLRRAGRDVPLLCSFDGFAPGCPQLLPLPRRVLAHARAIIEADAARRRAYVRDRIVNVERRLLAWAGKPRAPFVEPRDADPATQARLGRVAAALWKARGAYHPRQRLDADLLLIKTSVPTEWLGNRQTDDVYGWRSFVGGRIDVHTVPGEHLRMFANGNDAAMAELVANAVARLGA